MSKKKILIFISVILIIFGGVYLKMKYDEKAKQKKSTTKSNKNVSRFILNTTQKT